VATDPDDDPDNEGDLGWSPVDDDDDIILDLTNFEFKQQQRLYKQTAVQDAAEGGLDLSWANKNFEDLYTPEVLWKARRLVEEDKLEELKDGRWLVEGSTEYLVGFVDIDDLKVPWPTCTCPNGTNRANRPTCYHSAAVLMKVLQLDVEKFPYVEPKSRSRR
jgi:hypothetical protein